MKVRGEILLTFRFFIQFYSYLHNPAGGIVEIFCLQFFRSVYFMIPQIRQVYDFRMVFNIKAFLNHNYGNRSICILRQPFLSVVRQK